MPISRLGSGEQNPYIMQNDSKHNMNAVWLLEDGSPVKIWPAFKEIDYFEDGGLGEYTAAFSGTSTTQSGNLGPTSGGSRLLLDEQRRIISVEGDGLPNYPDWGLQWEFYFRPLQFYNTPAFLRCNFMGMNSYGTDRTYRLEWESDPTSGSDWSLEKRSGGSVVLAEATADGLGVKVGTVYRCLIDMTDTSSPNSIHAEWWNHSSNTKLRELDLVDNDGSGIIAGKSIGFETNGFMKCGFDTARILP